MPDNFSVEIKPIDEIIPYDNNPRLNEDAVASVADSIRQYGFRVPIVVDSDNVIICGHTRLLAARQIGLKNVPVHVARTLTPEQVRAFRLDDNKTAELAKWDYSKLAVEFTELKDGGFDLKDLAFSQDEINRILDAAKANSKEDILDGETDADDAPDIDLNESHSTPGTVYQLGDHRLLCGDCTDSLQMSMLLENDAQVALLMTDPPYNVAYNSTSEDSEENIITLRHRRNTMKVENDSMPEDEFQEFLGNFLSTCYPFMADGASYYIFYASSMTMPFLKALESVNLSPKQELIWAKDHIMFGRSQYFWKHEPILYGWKDGAAHKWYGERNDSTSTVLNFAAVKNCELHPTQKPVDLVRFLVKNSANIGDIVLDTFGGSGTTLMACEQSHRICRTAELNPAYCDAIRKRWAEFVFGSGCDWQGKTPEIRNIGKLAKTTPG